MLNYIIINESNFGPRAQPFARIYKSPLSFGAPSCGRNGMPLTEGDLLGSPSLLHREISPANIRKVPTGIADLDSIVDGGFPAGSTVLLLGEIGAGMHEYVYTAASKTAIVNERPESRHYYLGDHCDDSELPTKICYVTFARSKDIILQELAASFNEEYFEAFRDRAVFRDFSSSYFRNSVVPSAWTEQGGVFDVPSGDLLEGLTTFLDENAEGAMVVVDSLTDLAISEAVEMRDLVTMVKGLQRVAKGWGGLVYLLLTRGILEKRHEQMLMESVDGCLAFEWKGYARSSNRQRYMYVEKFTSVLPHLPRERIARFPTMVTANHGLVVVYMERIS